jgi:hypothetical protein
METTKEEEEEEEGKSEFSLTQNLILEANQTAPRISPFIDVCPQS